jgi:hypothetical protein
MASHLPLTEATGQEILTRTVYQLILADYRQNPEQYDHAATRLFDLALTWRAAGLELIADTLQDAARHVASGQTIASWRTLHTSLSRLDHLAVMRLDRKPRR